MGISTNTLLTKYGVAWYVPCHMGLRGGALPMLRSRGRMFHGACCGLHLMRCMGPLCICGHATVSRVPWVIMGHHQRCSRSQVRIHTVAYSRRKIGRSRGKLSNTGWKHSHNR